jgi:hypothetical protein
MDMPFAATFHFRRPVEYAPLQSVRTFSPHRDPIRWLSTPRILAIAVFVAIGGALEGAIGLLVFIAVASGTPPIVILPSTLLSPLDALASIGLLVVMFIVPTGPVVAVWAWGAIATRKNIERLRRDSPFRL